MKYFYCIRASVYVLAQASENMRWTTSREGTEYAPKDESVKFEISCASQRELHICEYYYLHMTRRQTYKIHLIESFIDYFLLTGVVLGTSSTSDQINPGFAWEYTSNLYQQRPFAWKSRSTFRISDQHNVECPNLEQYLHMILQLTLETEQICEAHDLTNRKNYQTQMFVSLDCKKTTSNLIALRQLRLHTYILTNHE